MSILIYIYKYMYIYVYIYIYIYQNKPKVIRYLLYIYIYNFNKVRRAFATQSFTCLQHDHQATDSSLLLFIYIIWVKLSKINCYAVVPSISWPANCKMYVCMKRIVQIFCSVSFSCLISGSTFFFKAKITSS